MEGRGVKTKKNTWGTQGIDVYYIWAILGNLSLGSEVTTFSAGRVVLKKGFFLIVRTTSR